METFFIDSNVFFYAKIMDKEYGKDCARILNAIADGGLKAVTSSLTIIEIANALRKYGLGSEVKKVVDALFSLDLNVFSVDPVDVRIAAEIFEEIGISPYDCTHVAIMKKAKTNKIISADKEFDKIPWIKRLDPKDF